MGWLSGQKAKHSSLAMHKILVDHDDNLKTTMRWCLKMSALAHSLRCSLENNPLHFLIIIQMVGWKFEKLEVENHEPT
jgi:hypothetical protein